MLSSRPNFSCLFRRLRKNGFPLAHSKTPFVLSTKNCPLQRHSNSFDLWFLALLTKICLFQNIAMKILKIIFNLFKETNGALSKPVLSKRNNPFTCQLCRLPNHEPCEEFIFYQWYNTNFFLQVGTLSLHSSLVIQRLGHG